MNYECGKVIKREAGRVLYCFFRNEFNKFNNTGAQMLDSVYQMIKSSLKLRLSVKKVLRLLKIC